jgi:hypothetical protein
MNPDQPKAGNGAAPGATPGKPGASPSAKAATPTGKAATPAGKASTKAGAASTPGSTAPGGKKDDDKAGAASKLDKAIAEGNVVITQDKVDADGNVTHSTGHGMKAVYDSSTGDITLSGRPDTSQGINTIEATDDSTIIIMNREGRMHADGPHKVTIRDSGADPTQPTAQKGKEKAAQPQ